MKENSSRYFAPEEIIGWRTVALGVGGIASVILLIAALIGGAAVREQALRSWLLGFIVWGGIGIGSLGILLLQYITGGSWGLIVRRILEASSRTWWVIALLFVPIAAGVGSLYEWTHPAPNDEILKIRYPYLNVPFWLIRAVLYFALWGVMAYLLNKWSQRVDETSDWSYLERASRFSGPTMVFFVLLVTFASVDWTMSLDPHWFSTMWGLLYVVGWGLSAFAFSIAILAWLAARAPMNEIVGKRHFHDLGKLVLALVMVWTYFNFSQFLIIWSGNLPEETVWYLRRSEGGWGAIAYILLGLHFAFPYLVLLSRDIKRNPKWLTMVALFIILMRFVDVYYTIGPAPRISTHGAELTFMQSISWMDFVAPLAVGGIWLWAFFGELRKRPLIPVNDPFLENAIEHGKGH